MNILGQILKLTALSIFFSAGATIYLVDSDFYKSFLKFLTPSEETEVVRVIEEDDSDKISKEEIKQFRKYLRQTEIDESTSTNQKESNSKSKSGSVWDNVYER